MDYQKIIDKYYPVGTLRRDIFMKHSRQVADLALELARRNNLDLDPEKIEAAAMLHDIGIFMTDAPTIGCEGKERYISHGPLGAALLRSEGVDEDIARVAERHTGTGISAQDYIPRTLLEKLVCYADKFYSKSGAMERKSFQRARASVARYGGDSLERFDAMASMFGRP